MSEKLYLNYTGNPFVDAGIFALTTDFNKSLEDITVDDLKKEVKKISNLYMMGDWNKCMYTIFPNSVLVNPAIKGDRSKLYLDMLEKLIEDISPIKENGDCIACGRRDSGEQFGRSVVPMTGSGTLKNYFSFANEGADYCSLCALLIQFSPLVMYRSGGKMIVLHSNSRKVMKFWAKKAIKNINEQFSLNNFTGCFDESFKNPTNAIFRMIQNIIQSYDERWVDENPSLNFYYFTNYNQGPDLDIYTVPTKVFKFLTYIPSDEWSNWSLILKYAYKYVKWDKVKEFDDYKNNPNEVYNRLLKDISILRFFYNFKYKKVYCSWRLVEKYMKEVRNMDEKRIDAIKLVADNLAEYIKSNDEKRVLSNLENASSYNSFRNVLRKIIKKQIANKEDKLLFSFDDYVIYLFPEGNLNWRETQDLILFRIYEKLHEWLVDNKYAEEFSEDINEEEE